jgi:hypothetical protein
LISQNWKEKRNILPVIYLPHDEDVPAPAPFYKNLTFYEPPAPVILFFP